MKNIQNLISTLNEMQTKYYIASRLDTESRNFIFIGLKRTYPICNNNTVKLTDKNVGKNKNYNKNQINDQISQYDQNSNKSNQNQPPSVLETANQSEKDDIKSIPNTNNESNSLPKTNQNPNKFKECPDSITIEEVNDYFNIKKCVAIKLIPYNTPKKIQILDNERNIQDLFTDADPIVKYKDYIEITIKNRHHILVIMHLHVNFDLLFYMSRPTFSYDDNFVCIVAYRSLCILKKLKERRVVHNDIKFENFIVTSENPFQIHLTDFESAEFLSENMMSSNFNGTPAFEAPEVLRGESHDFAADMWSLGVNLYYSLFLCYPYGIDDDDEEESDILAKIENESLKCVDTSIEKDAWILVEGMLRKDPSERITPEEALEMEWFKCIEEKEVKVKAEEYEAGGFGAETTNS